MAKLGAPQLSEKTISDIRQLRLSGKTYGQIANDLGVSVTSAAKYSKGVKKAVADPPANFPGEHWSLIPGFCGRYYVSDTGRVFSNGINGGRQGLLKPANNGRGTGYLMVILCSDGEKVPKYIHRLVAEAFVPGKTDTKNCVNHKDGNTHNNRFDNLEWVTYSDNTMHSYRVLGRGHKSGMPSRSRKLTDEQVRLIRLDARPASVVAKDYGVGHSTISNIRTGKYYKEVV